MTSRDALKALLAELDRLHPEGRVTPEAWNMADGNSLPNFATAANGYERHFSKAAQKSLSDLAGIKHESDRNIASLVEAAPFARLVRQCVADLHAEGLLSAIQLDESYRRLNEEIKTRLSQLPTTFTHYFPGWTLGMEGERPFILGPVTFLTTSQWIDLVDFSPETIRHFLNKPDVNARWKDSLKIVLANNSASAPIRLKPELSLAQTVSRAIGDCPSLLKVEISGYEFQLSRKVAEIVCKSALDSVSLLFGGKDYFYQQALAHEHLPPMSSSSIAEMDGQLLLPGFSWGSRLKTVSYPSVRDYLSQNTIALDALSHIMRALVAPTTVLHPNLAKRWSTALDWYAEGQRERNDAVALAKMATSLDVLSCGGKFGGIVALLANLLNTTEDTVVVKGRASLTLKQVVKVIYDKGRSQILHGTEFDRIKAFETPRHYAAILARLALIEAALRLKSFTGSDSEVEFRGIPAQ